MKFYYYRITNIKNGRFYIGITTNFKKRQQQHFNKLQNHSHPNYKMQDDYDVYGAEAFQMTIIEEFDGTNDDAYFKEYELIQKYHATDSYNILEGGLLNPVYSPQVIEKLKKTHQNKYDDILQYKFNEKKFILVGQYAGIRDAVRQTGCDFRAIQNCLKTAQSHHDYYWVKASEKDKWFQTFLNRYRLCVAKINETTQEIEDTALTIKEFADKYNTTYDKIYASIRQNNRCERKYKFIRITANQFAEINQLSL